jgi:hypothetical protein
MLDRNGEHLGQADFHVTKGRIVKDEQKMLARRADIHTGYMAYIDHEIELAIQAVEDVGERDNGASLAGTAARAARPGMGGARGGSQRPDYSPDGLQR